MFNPKKLIKELDELPKKYIVMITVNATDYLTVNLEILRYLCIFHYFS